MILFFFKSRFYLIVVDQLSTYEVRILASPAEHLLTSALVHNAINLISTGYRDLDDKNLKLRFKFL